MLSCFNKANRCIAIHGTNTSEEPSVTANCNGLPVCNHIASKLTKVLQPESISHSLKRRDNPILVTALLLKILAHITAYRDNVSIAGMQQAGV